MNGFALNRQADALLRQAGFTIWGRPKREEDFLQARFEARIKPIPIMSRSRRNLHRYRKNS